MEIPFEIQLGNKLSQFHWLLQNHLNKVLHPYGLTIEHFRLMGIVAQNNGCSQHFLVQETLKTKPAITTIVENMVKRNLVSRNPDPENRRTNKIFLTAKGKAQYQKIEQIVKKEFDTLFGDIPGDEIQTALATLNKMAEQLITKRQGH